MASCGPWSPRPPKWSPQRAHPKALRVPAAAPPLLGRRRRRGASPAKQPRVSPAMIAAAAETAAADSLAKAVERAAAKLPPTEGKRSTDLPCGAERAATLACYKSGGDVLQCGAVVDAFAACAARLL
eukprot:TRINITY_DN989_c0_g1_i3.p3 TRINITY_DN989_c0_g1~~TRINITY_DN989_c0_g1_i3.p3  ORF type:complete len:127 (-),score=36.92 TRINITY_DN989_c0_g1_i3:122-502(-)